MSFLEDAAGSFSDAFLETRAGEIDAAAEELSSSTEDRIGKRCDRFISQLQFFFRFGIGKKSAREDVDSLSHLQSEEFYRIFIRVYDFLLDQRYTAHHRKMFDVVLHPLFQEASVRSLYFLEQHGLLREEQLMSLPEYYQVALAEKIQTELNKTVGGYGKQLYHWMRIVNNQVFLHFMVPHVVAVDTEKSDANASESSKLYSRLDQLTEHGGNVYEHEDEITSEIGASDYFSIDLRFSQGVSVAKASLLIRAFAAGHDEWAKTVLAEETSFNFYHYFTVAAMKLDLTENCIEALVAQLPQLSDEAVRTLLGWRHMDVPEAARAKIFAEMRTRLLRDPELWLYTNMSETIVRCSLDEISGDVLRLEAQAAIRDLAELPYDVLAKLVSQIDIFAADVTGLDSEWPRTSILQQCLALREKKRVASILVNAFRVIQTTNTFRPNMYEIVRRFGRVGVSSSPLDDSFNTIVSDLRRLSQLPVDHEFFSGLVRDCLNNYLLSPSTSITRLRMAITYLTDEAQRSPSQHQNIARQVQHRLSGNSWVSQNDPALGSEKDPHLLSPALGGRSSPSEGLTDAVIAELVDAIDDIAE